MSPTSYSNEYNTTKPNFTEDISYLLKQDISNKKVLLYARETNFAGSMFRNFGDIIAKKYLKCSKYEIIADMNSPRDFELKTDKYSYSDYTTEDWKIFREILDIDAIIRNDRAFRHSIPYDEACEMIYSSTKFMLEFFRKHKYDVVLTNMMDFYVTEIVVLVAEYFKIPVISFCANSFGLNAIMITKRGESVYVREPEDKEVEDLYKLIIEKNTPFVISKEKVYLNAIKNYLRHKVKYLYHHLILNKLLKNKEYIYRLTDSGTYPRSLVSFFTQSSYFINDISQLTHLNPEKTVYIPLHYYPEATTDYWINHDNYTTYYPSLFETLNKYSEKGFNILVKEHTAMFLHRESKIYEQIKAIKNVFLISPFISTYEVFKIVDYVVVWTGTTGIEALIHDKKVVLAYSEPYYGYGKLFPIEMEAEIRLFTENEKKQMLRNILSTYLPII